MDYQEKLTPDEYVVLHTVFAGDEGMRLDAFLKTRYKNRSRQTIQSWINKGAITIIRQQSPHAQSGRAKASAHLMRGDVVQVVSKKKNEPEVNFNYRILFEDESIFVIEKPANLPVHPAGRFFFNTLLVHLKTNGHKDPLRAEREYYLVHRIDKETSGILLLSKKRELCAGLTDQFKNRTTRKRYLAVTYGELKEEAFTVDLPMGKDPHSKIGLKMGAVPISDGGQEAITEFKRLEVRDGFSLVECFPKTGRQHQIRLHLEAVGHPIVGDKLYGVPEDFALGFFDRDNLTPESYARLLLPRHALHATNLEFQHPVTGETMRFEAPLPNDLKEFFEDPPEKRWFTDHEPYYKAE